jgi:choline dehydrogenase-like flavoprotein
LQLTGVFYEVTEPNLTRDAEIYYEGRLASSLDLWKTTKTGVLSTFPFGAFAYGRLDDRLSDSVIWQNAPRESGRDPMGLTAKQPNIEFWNTECYGGPPQWMDFPSENKHSFAIITLLLNARSRGSVKLRSADPTENPIVDHNYLEDPLDTEVLAEGTRWSNEMMMNGKATNSVIKGSWPENLKHHAYKTREEWIPYVKQNATTCKKHTLLDK